MSPHHKLAFRVLPKEHIPLAHAIEVDGYPESEAATLKTLYYRQSAAPELVLGCYLQKEQEEGDEELVGYIISTAVKGKHLTHDCMYAHDPEGESVAVHSVCVAKAFHRQGIARAMLKAYLKHLEHLNELTREKKEKGGVILERSVLIAHEYLLGLYSGAGFVMVGESDVTHGPDPWFEMVAKLR